jgi:2'-5' RNA ligase
MGRGDTPGERMLTATPALSFSPDSLALYRSWLSPEGASYEPLERVALAR